MPQNNCTTFLTLKGSEKEMRNIYRKLNMLEKRDTSGVGVMLTELAKLFGLTSDNIKCKGLYCNVEFCENGIYMLVESPVLFQTELWEYICTKYKTLKYYYFAEEASTNYYAKNDKQGIFHKEKYIIRQTGESIAYVHSDKELIQEISKRLRKNLRSMSEVHKAVNQNNFDKRSYKRIQFHKVTVRQ